jgi:tartrate dehydratase beta subunit/fumarate hydratase class I family protein
MSRLLMIEQVVKRAVPWLPRLAASKLGKDAALQGAVVAARAQAHEEIAKALDEGATHPRRAGGSESESDELSRAESAVRL